MKKYLSLLLAIILVTATSVGTVFSDSNLEGMPDSLKTIVKDNYYSQILDDTGKEFTRWN